ncbi:uncharacterized protein A4U43_C04F24870 [Asparagus officinalis]|uniref:Uncharacterized protein n=1 Tax=Asparagus officinalis TaxID=4686 RepID=A0A5P1F461_ASPOF|nr:uncharacterized protein A4U43_C04F24870 [Asparagus officinalis]
MSKMEVYKPTRATKRLGIETAARLRWLLHPAARPVLSDGDVVHPLGSHASCGIPSAATRGPRRLLRFFPPSLGAHIAGSGFLRHRSMEAGSAAAKRLRHSHGPWCYCRGTGSRGGAAGCLGMGDCCEDEKLVRGCDGLVAQLDEVDGGGGDRSLEEELGEKEEEESDREFDEVQGVEEGANVGLERNIVHHCDSEQASERVGGLTNINGREHEVLGVVEGSGHYEDSDASSWR